MTRELDAIVFEHLCTLRTNLEMKIRITRPIGATIKLQIVMALHDVK